MMKSSFKSKFNKPGILYNYTVDFVSTSNPDQVFQEWMLAANGIFFKKLMKGDQKIIDGSTTWFIPYTAMNGVKLTSQKEPGMTPDEEEKLGALALYDRKIKSWVCTVCKKPVENHYYSVIKKEHYTFDHDCYTGPPPKGETE